MKKITLAVFILLSVVVFSFADFTNTDLFLLNPDPSSQALGASILAMTPNIAGFFTSPANNLKNFSKELQVSYTLFGQSIRGENATFLFPTKNIGNFSFMASHFEYGDTNPNMDFSSSIMFALNYVYPLVSRYPVVTEKGAVGITVKGYQLKNKVSTESDFVLYSCDLGLIYSLSFIDSDLIGGLAVKNIGNNIELNGVTEKQAQSLVASARYLLSDAGKVSIMADMIKNSEIDEMGFASGVECSLVYPLSIRVGWRDYRDNFNKGVTAGFSLNFNRVNIGYAFSDILEDNNDQHTLTLGFYFGAIPNPNKAYEHYLAYHLKKAQQAYTDKDYISARRQFEDILAIYPDESVARYYIKLLSEDLEQADQNLEGNINKYLAIGEVAMMKNNVMKAKKYFSKVLLMDNGNPDAIAGLKKIEEQIRERDIYNNRKKYEKEITQSWLLAMKYYDKGDFIYAKEELLKIIDIDPENAGALQYLDNIQKKIERVNVIQSHNVFKQGMDAYEKGDYENALSYFNAAYIANPQREDIKEYINQCNIKINSKKSKEDLSDQTTNASTSMRSNKQVKDEMKNIYNSGLEQFSQENYYEALKKFELLRTMASKYKFYDYREQTNLYIAKSRNAIADDLYKQGSEFELREEFEQAYDKYKESLKYVKNHKQSTKGLEKLNSIIAQQYYDQGLKAFSSGNRENAIKLLEESLKYDENKIEAKRALERIK